MKHVVNLTQHDPSPEQERDGVLPQEEILREDIKDLLTFHENPSREDLIATAKSLAYIARDLGDTAMIGGLPALMPFLADALLALGVEPVYSYSKRVSVDVPQADGSVRKVAVFRHLEWTRPYQDERDSGRCRDCGSWRILGSGKCLDCERS